MTISTHRHIITFPSDSFKDIGIPMFNISILIGSEKLMSLGNKLNTGQSRLCIIIIDESELMSISLTGSSKIVTITLNVSIKNILTVLSKRATANNLLSGLTLEHCTFSSNSNVFRCNNDNTFRSVFGKITNSNCHSLTVLSPPPVIQPNYNEMLSIISPAAMSITNNLPSSRPAKICLSPGTTHKH
ncbi:hypothetical protein AGLY_014089 [Aphis glycines]|uniref:Uncharacterized protein n=1 Tax=Aphis glycines TaxID=307491 RepID=A0A6G0T662_APHGL|nr:hypothetical protein AGLY_014089 [Aphis glycines]